ncbi:MAG: hypothetical protein PVH19_06385 [Planctomycetia bacterium]|jgi:adenosylhomocysteine nucleosidase
MIAILFALEIEAGGLIDLLGDKVTTQAENLTVYQGQLHDREVTLGIIGTGAERASKATQAFIQAYRPERIVLAGFSGGLQPTIRQFDIVLVDEEGVKLILVDADESKPTLLPEETLGPMGAILSVQQVIHSAEAKQQIGMKSGALVVDMESATVQKVCRAEEIPFSAMRIVIDPMDEELPADIQRLTDQPSMGARIGAAIGAICRRPSNLKTMVGLRENAIQASDRLARFLSRLYL